MSLCSPEKNGDGVVFFSLGAEMAEEHGRVPIQGLHPSKDAFEDRIRHSGASSAVPFRRVLRMRPRYAAFVSRI